MADDWCWGAHEGIRGIALLAIVAFGGVGVPLRAPYRARSLKIITNVIAAKCGRESMPARDQMRKLIDGGVLTSARTVHAVIPRWQVRRIQE